MNRQMKRAIQKKNPMMSHIDEINYRIQKAEDNGIKIGMYMALRLFDEVIPTVSGIGEKRKLALQEAIIDKIGNLLEEVRKTLQNETTQKNKFLSQ